jgi:hypothetical protein
MSTRTSLDVFLARGKERAGRKKSDIINNEEVPNLGLKETIAV